MYLLAHNAHLVSIDAPAIPADPIKGIVGQAITNRWTGDAQAWIDEDLVQIVRGNELFTVSQTLIKIPVNIPVLPNELDLITIVRLGVVQAPSIAAPASEVMSVRMIDQGNVLLGFVGLRCVRGGSS